MSTEENEQIAQRRAKLVALREQGFDFPNGFRRDSLAADILSAHGNKDSAELEAEQVTVKVAGRLMSRRIMGKASFAHLQDASGRIQLFLQRDHLPEGVYNETFKKLDIGDVIGVSGELFVTRTGELTVRVDEIALLVKSLRPLPEKFHGLTNVEMRYRQRYVDLMVNEGSRETFARRAATITKLRQFLDNRGYLEVETPIMHPIPGGANAKPFVTHHNALGVDLYLRVAQELYIKRLLVGGFEKVYEMNRNFRNEGLSTQHNPEFTMLEYNEAFVDYNDYMDLTEEMIREVSVGVAGSEKVEYQGNTLNFGQPFSRMTITEAVLKHNPDLSVSDCDDLETLTQKLKNLGVEPDSERTTGEALLTVFEETVEPHLLSPTFITGYPVEVSPLSRRSPENASLTDRFELFIAGRELANGFSELNDPEDQASRFREQAAAKAAGDEEAMHYDADYINALEYGLPPNAGGGLGIDRLVMILTNSASIRDVLLFPHMRPESH